MTYLIDYFILFDMLSLDGIGYFFWMIGSSCLICLTTFTAYSGSLLAGYWLAGLFMLCCYAMLLFFCYAIFRFNYVWLLFSTWYYEWQCFTGSAYIMTACWLFIVVFVWFVVVSSILSFSCLLAAGTKCAQLLYLLLEIVVRSENTSILNLFL